MTSDDDAPDGDRRERDEQLSLTVNGMPWAWDLAAGNLSLFGESSVAFGTMVSLRRLVSPLREELGDDLFRLLVALSSGEGTKQYYQGLITKYGSNFEEGFLAWGEAVATAGWGRFSLPKFDREHREAIVHIDNPWELQIQTGAQSWGCPFVQGKLIGIFSEAFGVTCWAHEHNIHRDGAECSIDFHIAPSQRTVELELDRLRREHQRARDGELAREVEHKTAALREAEERQRAVLLSLNDLVFTVDASLAIEDYLPPRGGASSFPARATALDRGVSDTFGSALTRLLRGALDGGAQVEAGAHELELVLDGEARRYEARFALRRTPGSDADGLTVVVRDVTQQRAVEAQLRQAQKMESLGQLASSIGHDFNNLLSAIMNATDLLAMQVPESLRHLTGIVLDASETAAGLIKRLLSFSRQGDAVTSTFNIHEVISTSIGLLAASVGRDIRVEAQLDAREHRVRGDSNQLQSALLNLGVNARDAMPTGGEVWVSTRNVALDADYCASAAVELSPGAYVEIVVRDTGVGMDELTRRRVFEPFFTTKALGEGTGLGLSAVYSAVGEHRGEIYVDSELGKGTSFRIRLPLHHDEKDDV